jgi:hypothetical protein
VRQSIVEEVAFRGVIQGSLEKVFSRRDAWLIQGMLVHGSWNAWVIYSEIAAH